MNKETGWYDGEQKPTRVGVYKRKYPRVGTVYFCWWDEDKWGFSCVNAESAKRNGWNISGFQNLPWCGLTGELK